MTPTEVHLPTMGQLSRALLKLCSSGEAVTRLTVWFTHGNLHTIFDPAGKICRAHPLELVLAKGSAGGERRYDLAHRVAPWHVDIRTAAQIKAQQERDATIRRLQEARDRAARKAPARAPESPPSR